MYIVSCMYAYNILQRYLSIYLHTYTYTYIYICTLMHSSRFTHVQAHTQSHTQTMHFISDCITRVARNQESAELDEQDR